MAWNAQLPDYFKQFDATGGSLSVNVPDTMGTQSNPLASSMSDQLQNQNQSQLSELQNQISQLMGSSSSAIAPAAAPANTTPTLTSNAAIPSSLSLTPSTPGAGTTTTTTTPGANSVVIPPIPNQVTVTPPPTSDSTSQATIPGSMTTPAEAPATSGAPALPPGWSYSGGLKPFAPSDITSQHTIAAENARAQGIKESNDLLLSILSTGWDPLTKTRVNASLPGGL